MMQRVLLLLLAVGSVHLVPTPRQPEPTCGYESCHATPAGTLNVHIVPHTHDDVGWLKTVDQYYYGSRNNIQKAGVQYILDSVVKELLQDPKRRFIYVETAFFWKWWVRQSSSTQQSVQALVREGRLQMVGGAWSMNDEAAAHYQSVLDQFTWGHRKLNDTFGHCGRPRVGWQIDPFGHSREFASLVSMMGMDGLFLGRIDYQDKRARFSSRSMEMLWRSDHVLGSSSNIFTGALYNTYSPPPGFCFDVLCSDEPIIDDPTSPLYNVESKINTFVEICANISKVYRSNNILLTMGEDFHYQDAAMWFKNLDKLIEYTNLKAAKDNLNVTLFYSTPNCYLKAIKDANPTLPTKDDDFFPYASDSTAFWTGYFTSRPTTKFFEREGNNYLQVVKQLQVLADLQKHNQFVLDELKSAMGVMQHHDAITGTEKQHVTHDYVRLLNQAVDDALIIAKQAFNKMTLKDANSPPLFNFQRCHLNESRCDISEEADKFIVTIYNPLGWSVKEPIRIPVDEGQFEVFGPDGKQIKTQLVPLPKRVIDLPTRKSKAVQEIVFLIDLKPISYISLYIKKKSRPKRSSKNDYNYYSNINNNNWLKDPIINKLDDVKEENSKDKDKNDPIPYAPIFSEDIPSIENKDINLEILKDGVNDDDVLALEKFLNDNRRKESPYKDRSLSFPSLSIDEQRMLSDDPRTVEKFDDDHELGNQFFKLNVNTATGQVSDLTFPDHSRLNFSINMYYYKGSCGNNNDPAHRASGAYIFRPLTSDLTKLETQKTDIINGDLVKEFRVNLSPNGFLNTRVYDGLNFIELEWIVGPIPIEDDIGKEYIIKYETNLINNGEFYTDSNGRQMLKRKLNFRPQWDVVLAEPVPGNYYPVTNEIYIKDDSGTRVTVLPDRSEGGTSLIEGEIELMLHRRLLCDDAFGVGEALNETIDGKGLVVRGKQRVIIGNDEEAIAKNVLGMHLSPTVLLSDATDIKYDDWLKFNNEFSWLNKDLPKGVHLLTLEPWDSKLLLRFENYLEDGKTVEVNLNDVFKDIEIKCLRETMLSANMFVEEYKQWEWQTEGPEIKENKIELKDDGLKIKVKSKQIRTFIACYEKKGLSSVTTAPEAQ